METLESTFQNSSFILLFFNMLLYWSNLIFSIFKEFQQKLNYMNLITFLGLSLLLITRWLLSGHFPLSNLYESLIFLAWSTQLLLFLCQTKTKSFLLGVIVTPVILFTYTFATFLLPDPMQAPAPLVPSLQSNWLMMHVTIMLLSYAALITGSLLAIAYLILQKFNPAKTKESSFKPTPLGKNNFLSSTQMNLNSTIEFRNFSEGNLNDESFVTSSSVPESSQGKNVQLTKSTVLTTIDNLSYRILGFGFPLLTLGILSGAVWANETWGSYWNWDPKETWALITWIVFAIYLHSRLIKKWKGTRPAIIASVGFIIVWVCYLGVNLVGKGLHSYGWWS